MTRFSFLTITALWIGLLVVGGRVVLAEQRFSDNGDGTVTDHQLGVMWAKTDNNGDISWKEAQQWIQFTFPYTIPTSYDNWRMPTLKELSSLYLKSKKSDGYETACGQWVQVPPEIQLSCGWVWSADTSSIQAHVFNFHRGTHYADRKVHQKAYRALAVRDLD
jgi:hypothetical protein